MTDSNDKNEPTQDNPDKPATPPTADPSPYNPLGSKLKIEKSETQGARPGMPIENNNDE